jgi:fucokinase
MTQFASSSAGFLQQAYANNWQQYLASLKPSAQRGWDIGVLTASDERQAAMYRRQLEWRREAGLLPAEMKFVVIPDPNGQRIGSGAATLRALTLLTAQFPALNVQRVLMIHSGGDSRRLPHCSVTGKLFARLPRELPDGRASTLFDEFLISLSGLSLRVPAGVLIASGDVLLIFDPLQLTLRRTGIAGVSAAAPVEMGTHHGVYVRGNGAYSVRAYLHKPSVAQMTEWDAIASDGSVQVDTGLVWMDAPSVAKLVGLTQEPQVAVLCGLSDVYSVPGSALNLYGDLLLPLAQSTRLESYLADTSDGPATSAVQAAREVIWNRLHGIPFGVEPLQPAMFIHFGTSQEYWRMLAGESRLREVCNWNTQTAAWVATPQLSAATLPILINSALVGVLTHNLEPALIIDSQLGELTWRGPAILSNIRTQAPLAVERDTVVHQTLLREGFVTRVFGLYDDPKRVCDEPGGTFMNRPWAEWLAAAQVDPEALWPAIPPAQRTLWNARLYAVCEEREESLRLSLGLQHPQQLSTARGQGAWLAAPRLSLQESFAQADGERVLQDISAVEDEVAARRFFSAILAETPARDIQPLLGHNPAALARRCTLVQDWLSTVTPAVSLRGWQALAVATGQHSFEDRAFHILADMIERSVTSAVVGASHAEVSLQTTPRCTSARVEAAARIDFGGGWTDTPPYSIEQGGTVLNAALALSPPGRSEPVHPIRAEATWLDAAVLHLSSQDIDASITPQKVGELLNYADPADPFALHKAALVMCGIIPAGEDPQRPITDVMREIGHGLSLSTYTFIPRGSGLGTSSIMAGTVLACLGQITGVTRTPAQLFDEVLALEQMLTTGGGWQDQVGGLVGGVKLITTQPGLPQVIHTAPVMMAATTREELAARLMVVYTGQQRLAKNLLHTMVAKWMAREPYIVQSLSRIAELALAMRAALEQGDVTAFGELMGEHWQVNQHMDPGCTNSFIDHLFDQIRPYISGAKLAGAGGGGFAMLIARDARSAHELGAMLETRYTGTPVAVWRCGIPEIERKDNL